MTKNNCVGCPDKNGCFGSAGESWCELKQKCMKPWEEKCEVISTTTQPIIGGDKDIHGCIGSAGYSWCEVKNKCLRVWEEKCENTPINSGPGDKGGSVACTMDAMMCPDGTYVGRSAPDCKFICPAIEPNIGAGENGFCGGIAGKRCASGLTCKIEGNFPDAGGKCVSEIN